MKHLLTPFFFLFSITNLVGQLEPQQISSFAEGYDGRTEVAKLGVMNDQLYANISRFTNDPTAALLCMIDQNTGGFIPLLDAKAGGVNNSVKDGLAWAFHEVNELQFALQYDATKGVSLYGIQGATATPLITTRTGIYSRPIAVEDKIYFITKIPRQRARGQYNETFTVGIFETDGTPTGTTLVGNTDITASEFLRLSHHRGELIITSGFETQDSHISWTNAYNLATGSVNFLFDTEANRTPEESPHFKNTGSAAFGVTNSDIFAPDSLYRFDPEAGYEFSIVALPDTTETGMGDSFLDRHLSLYQLGQSVYILRQQGNVNDYLVLDESLSAEPQLVQTVHPVDASVRPVIREEQMFFVSSDQARIYLERLTPGDTASVIVSTIEIAAVNQLHVTPNRFYLRNATSGEVEVLAVDRATGLELGRATNMGLRLNENLSKSYTIEDTIFLFTSGTGPERQLGRWSGASGEITPVGSLPFNAGSNAQGQQLTPDGGNLIFQKTNQQLHYYNGVAREWSDPQIEALRARSAAFKKLAGRHVRTARIGRFFGLTTFQDGAYTFVEPTIKGTDDSLNANVIILGGNVGPDKILYNDLAAGSAVNYTNGLLSWQGNRIVVEPFYNNEHIHITEFNPPHLLGGEDYWFEDRGQFNDVSEYVIGLAGKPEAVTFEDTRWGRIRQLDSVGFYFENSNAEGTAYKLSYRDRTNNTMLEEWDFGPVVPLGQIRASNPDEWTTTFVDPDAASIQINEHLIFYGNTQLNGSELFVASKGESTINLLKDINPGPDSGLPVYNTIIVDNRCYFSANDGAHGMELWVTDGTTEGTRMVADIDPGSNSSSPGDFYERDGTLFFSAQGPQGREVYRLQGHDTVPELVIDVIAGPDGSFPTAFTATDDDFYFVAYPEVGEPAEVFTIAYSLVPTESPAAQIPPTVFPNPVGESLLTLQAPADEQFTLLEVYTADGRLVLTSDHASVATAQLNLQHLPAGQYWVRTWYASGSFSISGVVRQ